MFDDDHLCALVLLGVSAEFDTIDHTIMLKTVIRYLLVLKRLNDISSPILTQNMESTLGLYDVYQTIRSM